MLKISQVVGNAVTAKIMRAMDAMIKKRIPHIENIEGLSMQLPITQESPYWGSPTGLTSKGLTWYNLTKIDEDINKQMLQELNDIDITITTHTDPPHDDVTKGSVTITK